MKPKSLVKVLAITAFAALASSVSAQEKPDILVIWGDDIGFWNAS